MKKNTFLLVAVSLCVLMLCGCSALPTKANKAEQQQLQIYLQRGSQYESAGKLVEARKQFELALTLDADNQAALEGVQRLKKKSHTIAEQHYNAGIQYHRKGRLEQARREFLIVLRLEPEHQGALRALRPYTYQYGPAKRYVEHTIRPGESLSMLAKTYYGDFKQYLLIADFNDIDDPKYIEVGQNIKIPEVAGLPFYADQYQTKAEPVTEEPVLEDPAYSMTDVEIEEPGVTIEEEEQLVDSEFQAELEYQLETEEPVMEVEETATAVETTEDVVTIYRDLGIELFDKEEYQGAIAEFTKVLNLNPDDQVARDYLQRSHVQRGIKYFDSQDYDTALAEFTEVLDQSPDNETVLDYSAKTYLKRGIGHFDGNDLDNAITDFTKVLTLQPQNETAISYLSKTYFKQGLDQYNKEEYLQARENFSLALDYDDTCEECREYLKRSDATFLETHYNKGLSYYGKQQLTEAVREWELVESVNPEYRDVQEKLLKAKDLQERLESIKMRGKE